MDYTRRLLILFQQGTKRFSRHPIAQKSNALENSILARLPIELLQQVANCLPIASAVSFSLSCRHIHLLIGTQYLENLAAAGHETLMFLKLIEHDFPNQIVCNSCKKLHRMQDAKKYTEDGQPVLPVVGPDCLHEDRKAMVTSYIHENFSTTVFKMAMKHYRQFGYDSQSRQLLNLLSGKVYSDAWGTFVRKQKVQCQIKNGSLFTCKRIAFHGKCKYVERDSILFWICPHLEYKSIGRPASLCLTTSDPFFLEEKWTNLLRCEGSTNIQNAPRDLCSELQQCRYCRTEYKTEFEHDDGCTIKFTIIIWKDLGPGPETKEWKAHFPPQDRVSFPQPVQFHRGEIASVFQVRGAKLDPK
ncbi:hypothetical protein BGZ60DRAFT_419999 [Tricladium varicosporioides]|nr:hypothetical protein BGZ60DRAFT_419999 [Hymenoscyphus varicosporioides]